MQWAEKPPKSDWQVFIRILLGMLLLVAWQKGAVSESWKEDSNPLWSDPKFTKVPI